MTDKKEISYKSYLALPTLLSEQTPLSGNGKSAAHDEMLFIIIHQTYELWFKQVLFELDRVQEIFSARSIKDDDMRLVACSLSRIVEILKHLVRQIDILETMTPLDFLDFRHVFRSASGFQSLQFRALEIRLGLTAAQRVGYDGKPYESYLSPEDRAFVEDLSKRESLFDQVDAWLARTPFVEAAAFDFWQHYRDAVYRMIDEDRKSADVSGQTKLDVLKKQFDTLFDESAEGRIPWRLSAKALRAALFVALYRDQPVLHLPFALMHHLMDIDELLTLWRYRHALMVQRMLGMKMGSGGSSGHDYLVETAAKHRIFGDFFALSTFMIPRSALPSLPREVESKMGFRYWDAA